MNSYVNASLRDKGDISSLVHKSGNNITANEVAEAFSYFGNDVFCVIDESLNFLYLSENWNSITGLSIEESIDYGVKWRIFPEHLHKITSYLSNAGGGFSSVRFKLKYSDNYWHWCEIRIVDFDRNKSTGKTYYKCLLNNVTELVNIQDNFEKAKIEAEIANKSRSEFLASMNHELRTPLNAIIGFAQMMESGVYGDIGHPKYSDYIGNIQASGFTLLSKLSDLIEIANIDAGRMLLDEVQCDLVKLVHEAIELHSHGAFAAHVELRENLPEYPVIAVVDRVRILQVVTNILSNAVKHNRPGGTVDIYCEKCKDGGVNLVVEDTGKGIASTHLERILLAFRQDNSFFARSRDCVGLGLALSKEIIKLHQGKIEIESKHGEGTVIKIVLPGERLVKKPEMRTLKTKIVTTAF